MTSFDTHGFLSDEAAREAVNFEKNHPALTAEYRNLAAFAHRARYKVTIDGGNVQHILVTLLFGKALRCYEGVLLLSARGMETESDAVLRSLLETTLSAVAADLEKAVAEKIIQSGEHTRKRLLQRSVKYRQDIDPADEIKAVEDLAKSISDRIKEEKIEELRVKDIAVHADMLGSYEVTYAVLCLSAHPDVRKLQDALKTDKEGNLEGITWGPIYQNVYSRLSSAMDCLAQILQCRSLGLPADMTAEALAYRHKALDFLKQHHDQGGAA